MFGGRVCIGEITLPFSTLTETTTTKLIGVFKSKPESLDTLDLEEDEN